MSAMPHTFLRTLDDPDSRSRLVYNALYGSGTVLLVHSIVFSLIPGQSAFGEMMAFAAACLLGAPLVFHALKDSLNGSIEMNELAALSFTASLGTGQYRTAAYIAIFMILTQMIENSSRRGARKNIEELLRLSPRQARVIRDGAAVTIDAEKLSVGDIVEVLPGEYIPGDGNVLEGTSTIDESTLTGEALPVEKNSGLPVYSGTTNLTGRLLVRMSAGVADSTLAAIKDLITRAESSKTPIQLAADKYASWYTPLVLILAALVFFATRDINRAIAMLIIACPCIILVSGPTAMIAALGSAARRGVLFRDVSVLETAARITTIAFDKTGTLTKGSFSCTGISTFNGYCASELVSQAASLARFSRHPLSQGVHAYCLEKGYPLLPVDDFTEHHGAGVSGTIDGKTVSAGKADWIEKCCSAMVHETGASSTSAVHIAIDGVHAGILELADVLKPDACRIMDQLRKGGIEQVFMMTGDRPESANTVAGLLGCTVHAGLLPHEKMAIVARARAGGAVVAVVGDGINDAPALAAGDIGIAMGGRGCDVAVHSSSVVLMNDRLDRIPYLIQLSKKVVKTINRNIVFGSVFIVTMMGLSAYGAVSPILAAALHTLSAIIVMAHSARLVQEGSSIA